MGRTIARPTIACACAVLIVATLGCGDLSRGELSRGVESLSAIAAQGELIASGVARDATKSTYTRVMAKTMGGEAEHEAEKLADAEPEEAVAPERHAAVLVAEEIAELYSQLQVFSGDEHHGAVIQKRMEEAKEKADAIAERLTGEEQ
jgi:uncharacterized protein YciI